jgi:hypothetical protein
MQTLIPIDRLEPVVRNLAPTYASAQPFPHVVFDDLLPADVAEEVYEAFCTLDRDIWKHHEHAYSQKLACNDLALIPEAIRGALLSFNEPGFLQWVERLTGIPGLVADPGFEGGGMHLIRRGGFLKIHADFNVHPRLQLDRRLNLLLYMNKDWSESYGGHLELWDRTMTRCVVRVAPVFNRCVIFSTTDIAFHGHPDPLDCPPGLSRKSLAVYYYTAGRPAEERSARHSTIYKPRPEDPVDRVTLTRRVRGLMRRVASRVRGR